MATLFGQHIEPDFDLAKEQRRDRFWWPLLGGLVLCMLYDFLGFPFSDEVFQGFLATALYYGENFYVRRKNDLGRFWLWKAIFATIPLHVIYLAGIFGSDKAFPEFMTKAVVFIPIIAVGFAIESILTRGLIDRFKPRDPDQSAPPMTET